MKIAVGLQLVLLDKPLCSHIEICQGTGVDRVVMLMIQIQQVAFNGQLSATQPVVFGVPQGSVLGPLLYVLYTAELAKVVARHGLQMHQ